MVTSAFGVLDHENTLAVDVSLPPGKKELSGVVFMSFMRPFTEGGYGVS
jgi:hypothetical protein